MIADKVDIKTAQTRFFHATPGLMIRLYAAAEPASDFEASEDW